ncbi:hypothetical protein FE784_34305 [Paenibacillus hemerocallicola]|uniref:Uncharacterized protein n=1 Tax=Paenibacillus hemerocallicola TaxID=1172614 RepID=A0A5C4T0S2_9BACL|nr:hypothetical protein [Paenibacillus hemerocallicola]TNJ61549.1 hypothetical protein FE784_34305 [Paenibacillus hemerocallicola]
MKIIISLSVGGEQVKEDVVEIEDDKLEELSEEEVEAAAEAVVRQWADRKLSIAWEVAEPE